VILRCNVDRHRQFDSRTVAGLTARELSPPATHGVAP
jgi:hypothetical protein